jgi:hypothetical protein
MVRGANYAKNYQVSCDVLGDPCFTVVMQSDDQGGSAGQAHHHQYEYQDRA